MTRKAALNILTETIERSGGAGTGIRPKPPDLKERRRIAESLRKLARTLYPEETYDNCYPVRLADEIDPPPLESGD